MPRPDLSTIDVTKIISFKAILAELSSLDKQLDQSKLKQFIVFNKAYCIVTSAIKDGVDKDEFDNPAFIEEFSIGFAKYYFQAINDTLTENPDLTIAWSKMNQTRRIKFVPVFIPLLMGANAHINHDFPLTLVKVMDTEKMEDLLKDVLKIDKILMKTGKQIIGAFDEQNKSLDFLKRCFQFLYFRPTMYMVLYWRIKAWRTFKSIRKNGMPQDYGLKGMKTANRFLKVAGLLGSRYTW